VLAHVGEGIVEVSAGRVDDFMRRMPVAGDSLAPSVEDRLGSLGSSWRLERTAKQPAPDAVETSLRLPPRCDRPLHPA